ncbi:MAG: alpha/beta hydrolase [Candidatus Edwardsbacteria bacterium]|nr:alpha/beta hydrolase [Candidatus Edwardsbacteria bacterium]
MKRIALALIAAAALAALAPAQPAGDNPAPGAPTEDQLKKANLNYELDVPYAGDANPRHRLDIYISKGRMSGKIPVIVFLHGGGWAGGDKAEGAGRLLPLVRGGSYAGVAVGYRLTGEAVWPAQLHDCKAAVRWLRANAAKYGLDPDRIGAWGVDAGGHLALMLGATGDAPALEGSVGPHAGVSSRVSAVANFGGATELLAIIGQPGDIDRHLETSPEALLVGGGLRENPGRSRAASPVAHASAGDPPVLTVHGDQDMTVPHDQAERLDAALRKAGVASYFVTVRGGGHGDFGTLADGRVKEFLDKNLKGKGGRVSTSPLVMKTAPKPKAKDAPAPKPKTDDAPAKKN